MGELIVQQDREKVLRPKQGIDSVHQAFVIRLAHAAGDQPDGIRPESAVADDRAAARRPLEDLFVDKTVQPRRNSAFVHGKKLRTFQPWDFVSPMSKSVKSEASIVTAVGRTSTGILSALSPVGSVVPGCFQSPRSKPQTVQMLYPLNT